MYKIHRRQSRKKIGRKSRKTMKGGAEMVFNPTTGKLIPANSSSPSNSSLLKFNITGKKQNSNIFAGIKASIAAHKAKYTPKPMQTVSYFNPRTQQLKIRPAYQQGIPQSVTGRRKMPEPYLPEPYLPKPYKY